MNRQTELRNFVTELRTDTDIQLIDAKCELTKAYLAATDAATRAEDRADAFLRAGDLESALDSCDSIIEHRSELAMLRMKLAAVRKEQQARRDA